MKRLKGKHILVYKLTRYIILDLFKLFVCKRDRQSKREVYLRNLKAEGLTISQRMKHLENGLDVRFDLISAEDKMLETYAEILQLRMPLKRDEKMEKLEMMKPKYGFHILKWIHDMMKTHFPEFMKKVTPSLPNLKVAFYLKTSTKLFTTF